MNVRAMSAIAAVLMSGAALAVSVDNARARQRWPWNNLVDVDFTLSGVESSETFYRVDVRASYDGMAGDAVVAKTLVSEPVVKGNGNHRIVWNMGADIPGLVCSNLAVTVSAAPLAATETVYMVVDLTAGSTATSYPVRYSFVGPDTSSDVCRTTEMWFRLCPAGTFTMGTDDLSSAQTSRLPAHQVTLTKPFYLGVFEVTQEQYYRVKGTWPSYYTNVAYRATRPVEKVQYTDLRPPTSWYSGAELTGSTFMALMRERTGLKFDLPTEAQWEYACRAGTTGLHYKPNWGWEVIHNCRMANGTDTPNTPGPVSPDDDTKKGTARVGSYDPNPWGFYDMYGNVAEICGDGNPYSSGCNDTCIQHFAAYTGDFIDPRGPIQHPTTPEFAISNGGVVRGGSHQTAWPTPGVTSVCRDLYYATNVSRWGFRVCLTAE